MKCWIATKWEEFISVFLGRFPIDGCSYYETYKNSDIQVLKCMECGKYSVGYTDKEPQPPIGVEK